MLENRIRLVGKDRWEYRLYVERDFGCRRFAYILSGCKCYNPHRE